MHPYIVHLMTTGGIACALAQAGIAAAAEPASAANTPEVLGLSSLTEVSAGLRQERTKLRQAEIRRILERLATQAKQLETLTAATQAAVDKLGAKATDLNEDQKKQATAHVQERSAAVAALSATLESLAPYHQGAAVAGDVAADVQQGAAAWSWFPKAEAFAHALQTSADENTPATWKQMPALAVFLRETVDTALATEPWKQPPADMPATLASIAGATDTLNRLQSQVPLVEDLPGGTTRYSLLAGYRHATFENGSGDSPVAGLAVYHRFSKEPFRPHIFAGILFTGSEYKDQEPQTPGADGSVSFTEVMRSSRSFCFAGGTYLPLCQIGMRDDLGIKADCSFGPVVKGGSYVRVADTGQGNDTQGWVMAGARLALGTNSFLDVGWGRNEDLYRHRLILQMQVPILLLDAHRPGVRVFFQGEGNLALNTNPDAAGSDDIFRFSVVAEIPFTTFSQRLRSLLMGAP